MAETRGRKAGGQEFPKVREAREALRQKAIGIWERYEDMIAKAVAAGDYETANDAYQFLITHMPADEDGTKMIDTSVDKAQRETRRSAPTVNIGLQLGGVAQVPLLPPAIEVIDVGEEQE